MSDKILVCDVATYLPINKLNFHPSNPRRIRPDRLELLKDSIVEKGFYQPILVWKKKNIVLAGNHRLLAVQELIKDGYEFVTSDGKHKDHLPVVVEDVSDEVAEAILYETNNLYAEWVEDKLREAIIAIESAGRSPIKYGFEQSEVDRLLASAIKDADDAIDKIEDEFDSDEDLNTTGERLRVDPPADNFVNQSDSSHQDNSQRYVVTVVFDDSVEMEKLFFELRDRGLEVRCS